jgi:SpoVK/Ycf46/Vps4 family AAA+-type ATPase
VTEDDEERFLSLLRAEARKLPSPVWIWSATRGLARDGMPAQYGTRRPMTALEFVAEITDPGVFVFADAAAALDDPIVLRQIKDIAQQGRPGQTLILAGPQMEVPPELAGLAARWTLSPPTEEELEGLVRRISDDLAKRGILPAPLDDTAIRSLGESLVGLSAAEAEQVVRRTALDRGSLQKEALGAARDAKAEVLGSGGVIELVGAGGVTLDGVGGMANLKAWLEVRGRAFEPAAKAFGVDPPRGVLLTGIPGCGKSFVAKSLARTWNLPLVLLDPARLYGSYVGQSEQRLHESLETVQAMAPVVLWIDELEKGFAAGGEGDGGVSARILGTFLRWMQDREPGAFLVATANDVAKLPPELLRKGRFDEIFFVDLPGEPERRDIFRMQLARRKRDPAVFDLDALAAASEGFSGAEIEASIVATLYDSYAASADVTTERVLAELKRTEPLSRSRAEDVERLRGWARDRAVPA